MLQNQIRPQYKDRALRIGKSQNLMVTESDIPVLGQKRSETILELEHTRALDGTTAPIIILLFTQDGITESEVFGNSMVFCLN